MRENIIEIIFSAVELTVHAAGHKFIEINLTILIHVHYLQYPVQFVVADVNSLGLESSLYLTHREEPIVECIDLFEKLSQLLDFFSWQLSGNKGKADSF